MRDRWRASNRFLFDRGAVLALALVVAACKHGAGGTGDASEPFDGGGGDAALGDGGTLDGGRSGDGGTDAEAHDGGAGDAGAPPDSGEKDGANSDSSVTDGSAADSGLLDAANGDATAFDDAQASPPGCYPGVLTASSPYADIMNACTDAAYVVVDNCARLGLCDGAALPPLNLPPDSGIDAAPVHDATAPEAAVDSSEGGDDAGSDGSIG